MSKELTRLSIAELDAVIAEAGKAKAQKLRDIKAKIKADIEAMLGEQGLTLEEVFASRFKTKPEPLPAKYCDPADAGRTWSGRGRVPGWLQAQLDDGASLESFRDKARQ